MHVLRVRHAALSRNAHWRSWEESFASGAHLSTDTAWPRLSVFSGCMDGPYMVISVPPLRMQQPRSILRTCEQQIQNSGIAQARSG